MPITIRIEDDYILYEVLCDYCDREYWIRYNTTNTTNKAIECCPFCSNFIEEISEGAMHEEEDRWN